MFTAMRHHAASLRKVLPAEIADVRSLAFVNKFVHPEGHGSRKSLCAHLALVRPFAGVSAAVQLQRVIRREILATLGAQEALRVQARVITKSMLRGEAIPAQLAPITLRRGLPQSVNSALVRDQVRSLRISITATLADESLGV